MHSAAVAAWKVKDYLGIRLPGLLPVVLLNAIVHHSSYNLSAGADHGRLCPLCSFGLLQVADFRSCTPPHHIPYQPNNVPNSFACMGCQCIIRS